MLPGFDDSFKRGSAAYTLEDSEEQRFATIAVLECRGCELTEFDPKVRRLTILYNHGPRTDPSGDGPQGTWTAKGAESGTVFDEIDLSNESGNEWSDYDEKVRLPLQSSTTLSFRPLTQSPARQAGTSVSIMEFETKIARA
jgi:hypothetical protein